MNPLPQVDEQDIERLNQLQFADILNRLLKAEAQRYGIHPLDVKTTLRINDPDGGVDARVEHSGNLPSVCRIPQGLSVWQYKAGKIGPTVIRKKESRKRGVQDAIQAGGSYCFVVGKAYTDKPRKDRESAVNSCYVEKGLAPKGRFLTAQNVADWVSDHLSVAMHPYFGRPVSDQLLIFQDWNNLAELNVSRVGFEADDQRKAIIEELGQVIDNRTGFTSIRIGGRTGIGKTRLALEAIRANGLEDDTLYAQSPLGLPPELFTHISARPSLRLVLVVDECSYQDMIRLQRLAQRCGDRLVLVTVGYDQPLEDGAVEPATRLYCLKRLDDEAIRRIVQQVVPTMHPELASYIVRSAGGYVKLATAMAEAFARNPGLAGAVQVTGIPNIRFNLESLVPDPNDRRAMQALSLLKHIGLEGDVAVEGEVVARFMGINFRDLQLTAERMRSRGLVVKRGRYRYVTPHLLAVWFAAEVWRAMGDSIIKDLLLAESELPFAAKEALLERLADLGDEEIAAPVVERLLGPEGLFPSVEELDDQVRSRVFAILAKAAPRAAANTLERVLGHLPRDRLLNFRMGRRQVIWTLEKLLWLEDTFWTAARLLLKLAEAENETVANSATGTWCDVFYMRLGGTPVPAPDRHVLIREALQSPLAETRLIGVQAISRALGTRELRMRGSDLGGYVAPKEWRPKTWGEIWEARRSALNLLDQALDDGDTQVAGAARQVLVNAARGLTREGLVDDVLFRLRKLPLLSESDRRGVWEVLQQLLHYEGEVLNEDQRTRIQQWAAELMGTSFHDRLRRWVGRLVLVDRQELREAERSPEEMAASMAEEGYREPDALHAELEWLASPDAELFYFFGRRLGQLDSSHAWLADLVAQIRSGGNPGLLTAYLQGCSDSGEEAWVERLLDEWAERNQEMTATVFDATWRAGGSDDRVARIVALVDKGWIQPPQLGLLAWGSWINAVSASAMESLLRRLIRDKGPLATESTLSLLLNWLETHPDQTDVMAEYALPLLERPNALRSQGMFLLYWKQVAKTFVPRFPSRIAQAILSLFLDPDFMTFLPDDRMDVLKECLLSDPGTVWSLIGEMLLRGDMAGYRLGLSMDDWGVEDAGVPRLMEWAESHEPEGARVLAQLAQVEGIPLPPLARQLLIRYGRDESIRHSLGTTFLSGSWWGSQASWLQGKLDIARNWLNDTDASVKDWAQEIVRWVEADIRRIQQREEEESLWY
jgi:hypothetical protein